MIFKTFEQFIAESLVNEQNYSHGCVMAQIDKESIKKHYPEISEEELYIENEDDYGFEDEPHVTALYGLHSDKIEDNQIKEICEKYENIDIQLKDISMFNNEKYDVLKFGVESKSLRKMNEELTQLPHSSDFPDYKPHVTIAYLKKGEGKKYLKEFNEPIVLESKVIEYSKPGEDNDPKRKVYFKIKD